MEPRQQIEQALQGLTGEEEEILDVFFSFANQHLEAAVETGKRINTSLDQLVGELRELKRAAA
jgi:hypothetical protein